MGEDTAAMSRAGAQVKFAEIPGSNLTSGTEQERRPGLVSRRVLPVCFARPVISFCFLMDPPLYKTWEISHKKPGSLAFHGKLISVSTRAPFHVIRVGWSCGGGGSVYSAHPLCFSHFHILPHRDVRVSPRVRAPVGVSSLLPEQAN